MLKQLHNVNVSIIQYNPTQYLEMKNNDIMTVAVAHTNVISWDGT